MSDIVRLALWSGLLAAVLGVGTCGILLLRKRFLSGQEDQEEQSDSLCTTARLERMRGEGQIDEKQYETLKKEVEEASRRRAAREAARKRTGKKTGLFG